MEKLQIMLVNPVQSIASRHATLFRVIFWAENGVCHAFNFPKISPNPIKKGVQYSVLFTLMLLNWNSTLLFNEIGMYVCIVYEGLFFQLVFALLLWSSITQGKIPQRSIPVIVYFQNSFAISFRIDERLLSRLFQG